MKKMFLKAMSVMAGLAMSVSLVACGDDDNSKDEPTPVDEDKVETVEVSYAVDLGKAYWDYFDITVEYTTSTGTVETKTLTQAWSESYKVSLANAASTYICKVTATPKANHPEVVSGVEYDLSTKIIADISGKTKSGKYDPDYGSLGSNKGNWAASANELNRHLEKTSWSLLDFNWVTKK